MLDTILSALLPMVFTFLLGFVAARRHDFGPKDASTLNRMVLQYAVPMALFAGTVTTSRTALSRDIPLVDGFSHFVTILRRTFLYFQQKGFAVLA